MSEIVEKSVIGAILIDPKCISEIYEQIRLEMFGSSFCRSVYAEILKAYDAGKQITLISIAQKLQGESFSQERIMQELKGILPDIQAYKIKSYADALVAEYKTRRLKEMLSKIIPAAGVVDEQINTMLQRRERMKNISISGKKVIKVQNGHISIAFPTGIEKTGKAIRKMLKLLVQAEKEEERKPHNKDQIYKTLDGKFAVEFEKLFGKGACKKVFGVQKPSYTLYLEFFDKLNGLFEEWIKKI